MLLGGATLFALTACGQSTAQTLSRAAQPSRQPAPTDVLDYAPAAGLRWLAYARPAQIADNPALASALSGLLPPARLDAYERATAVDLRKLPAALVAGYDLGILYVAALPSAAAPQIRERFASRLTDGGIVKQVRSDIYRISGTEKDTPLALVSVENRMVALASGDLTLARVVEAYAARRLKSPTALRGAALSTLAPPATEVLVAFYAPGPFSGATLAAAPRLLDSSIGLGLEVSAASATSVTLSATLAGEWSEPTTEREELARVWKALAESQTGRLLGLDTAQNVDLSSTREHLRLTLELAIAPLISGLRALTVANAPEIFDLIPSTPNSLPDPN